MPRKEDIIGIIFCNKPKKLIPNFGRSQTTNAINNTAIITIKAVFCCLKLLPLASRIFSTVSLVLLLSFVFKNGRNIHAANKIRINKRIIRIIKIFSLFLVASKFELKITVFSKHILFVPNSQ